MLGTVAVAILAAVVLAPWHASPGGSASGPAVSTELGDTVSGRHGADPRSVPSAPTLDDPGPRASPLDDAHRRVRVRDESGRPVARARVYLRAGPLREVIAVTDEQGRTSVTRPTEGVVLGAWAEGLLASEREVPPEQANVEVVLGTGGTIRGRVFWMDGTPVGDEARVTCWRTGYAPAHLADDPATVPRWRVVRSEPDGGFEITGLDPETTYSLSAVGPWAIAAERMRGVRPDGGPRLLSVSPLHGLEVVVTGPEGRALTSDPRLGISGIEIDERASRGLGADRVELDLLGITPAPDPPGGKVKTFLYAASTRLELMGPFSFSFALPGYEPASAELLVPRVTSADLDRRTLELTALTDSFGSLDVTLEGVMDPGRPIHARQPIGVVRLAPLDGSLDTRRTWLRGVDAGRDRLRVQALPAGTWDVSWRPAIRFPGPPTPRSAARVEIGDEPAHASLDIGPAGGLAVAILEPDGSPYHGTAAFGLHLVGGPYWSNLSFHEAPYLMTPVPPGTYELRVTCPHPGGRPGEPSPTFVVNEGAVTEITLPRP